MNFDLQPFADSWPDGAAREPFSSLSMVAGEMQVWPLSAAGRWLGLVIGQADPEYPIELVAAVGVLEGLSAVMIGSR